jgi:CRP/FNR family transcriptional regulator
MLEPIKKELKAACSNCNLRDLCMPVGLSDDELDRLDTLVSVRKKVLKNAALFRSGDEFSSIYAIRTGTFKTRIATPDGRDQVTGFQMSGEILGLDGIGNNRHMCDAVALENSEVCVIPYEQLDEISQVFHTLQQHFHRIMSREIVRDQGVMLLLGSMRAEERLAAFLLNLAQRQQARGYSGKDMLLRMTREEIGSYLGLKLETVSRTLSKMQDDKLIKVVQKEVQILNIDGLKQLVGNTRGSGS